MAWSRRLFQLTAITIITLIALTLVGIGAVQIQQHVKRRRAERLLRDLQSVTLRSTTFAQVNAVFSDRARKTAQCDSRSCDYEVELDSSSTWHLFDLLQRFHLPSEFLVHMVLWLGVRPARINAGVSIRNGIAWKKSMTLDIATPGFQTNNGRGPDYTVIGSVRSVSRFAYGPHGGFRRSLLAHPDYIIGRPSACTGCVLGYVLFTPYAAPEDVQRLMHFDLSCLTRFWHPCQSQADIMPCAWAQYEEKSQRPESKSSRQASPKLPEILGRDASLVATVKIAKIGIERDYEDYISQRAIGQVLQVIKGKLWREGDNVSLQVLDHGLQFHNNDYFVLLLDPIWTETKSGIFNVESWEVLQPTGDNLSRIRAGIAQDFESGSY